MEAECPQRRRLVSTARKEIPRGLTSLEITDFHCHAIKKKIKELYEPTHSF